MYGKNINEILKEILKDDFFVSSTTFRSDDLKQKMNNVKKK